MTSIYRTLVRGRLRQLSSIVVGGSLARVGGADIQCARDGRKRLTIPGTSLAGCLIETAGRIRPDLFVAEMNDPLRRITSKRHEESPEKTLQSLWRFRPAHRQSEWVEWRQGVGIRQATGATAVEAGALYDLETMPPGEEWDFFLEIDTQRGGPKVEALALLALGDWARGRCWLGAGAARGLGWMELVDWKVLRLPLTVEAVTAWPDNTKCIDELFENLDGERLPGEGAARDALRGSGELSPDRFCYVQLTGVIGAGEHLDKKGEGWGWDVLSVGGHAAGMLDPLSKNLVVPHGVNEKDFRDAYAPDHPVVTSGPDEKQQKPLVPGSGLRGPLRHAASRVHRVHNADLPDPNERDSKGDTPKTSNDPISTLFGLVERSGRLLISDARLDGEAYTLALLHHHAEDEFTGGVYGSAKFDRTVVLKGRFTFRLVIEAEDREEMRNHLTALRPALRLAELGFVPVGGAKTRGAGGLPWKFEKIESGWAGQPPRSLPAPQRGVSIVDALGFVDQFLEGDAK